MFVALEQIREKSQLQGIGGSKICMPSLRGMSDMTRRCVPGYICLAQPGSRGNDRNGAMRVLSALVQGEEVISLKVCNPICDRLQIVEEADRLQAKFFPDRLLLDDPSEIRDFRF